MSELVQSLGLANTSKQVLDHFKTGSIIVDMGLAVIITQLVMMMFHGNMLYAMYDRVVRMISRTGYPMNTVVHYNPQEADSNLRNGSQSAYRLLYEYFCEMTKGLKLKEGRLILSHKDDQDIIHKWNAGSAVKQVMPAQAFEWNGMRITFQNEKTEERSKERRRRSRFDDDDNSTGNSSTQYCISIDHHTSEQLDELIQQVVDYMETRYNYENGDVRFQYYTDDKGDLDYQIFNSTVQKISIDSVALPPQTKSKLKSTLKDFKAREGYYNPKYGNPERLVFVIHGKPGNGKWWRFELVLSPSLYTPEPQIHELSTIVDNSLVFGPLSPTNVTQP